METSDPRAVVDFGFPPPKPSERLLIAARRRRFPEVAACRVSCTTLGRAQLAYDIARSHPSATVVCHVLDAYLESLARAAGPQPENLQLRCDADFAYEAAALAAVPVAAGGDAELTRDLLQQAYDRLAVGGTLLAATDNPRDTWLDEVLKSFGGRARRESFAEGAVYELAKQSPLRRPRDFTARFAFRDRGRLFRVASRPGTFSHRRIDPGARHLIDALDVRDGERVLDIGCGWGAVALAAAALGPNVVVEAIDSHVRAVACTRSNAEANGLAGQILTRLEAFGQVTLPGKFDAAYGNPPYYADFQIARLFITAAFDALRPGGRLTFVTKFPDWYFENLPAGFTAVRSEPVKGYHLVRALRRG